MTSDNEEESMRVLMIFSAFNSNVWEESCNESKEEADVHDNCKRFELSLEGFSIMDVIVVNQEVKHIERNEVSGKNHEVQHDDVLSKQIKDQKTEHNSNECQEDSSLLSESSSMSSSISNNSKTHHSDDIANFKDDNCNFNIVLTGFLDVVFFSCLVS